MAGGFVPAWTKEAVAVGLREAGCANAELHSVEGEWVAASAADLMAESGASIRMFPGYRALDETERQRFEDAYVAAVVSRAGPGGTARIVTRAFVAMGHLPN